MDHWAFVCKCIADTFEGIQDGLSHFSGPSRAAVIFQIQNSDPVYIFDPQHLLRGHEPRLEELYLKDTSRYAGSGLPRYQSRFGHMAPLENPDLAGLISYGGCSRPVFHQMWFTEHHPDMCATGPTECWLEHAAWRFSHDLANQSDLYTGISGAFLREYATHAVRDYLVDRMNVALGWDTQLRIFPMLDAVLGISKTREEGAWPKGWLVFVEPSEVNRFDFVARFPEDDQPLIENFKHVRKLLQSVEGSSRVLVSDGLQIIGIADDQWPPFCIGAEFCGSYGFLKINRESVCSFADGRFGSSTHRAKLVQVEEALLESDLAPEQGSKLFQLISQLVHHAQQQHFGCTLVVDMNSPVTKISGQRLSQPLDLQQMPTARLAQSLAKVDGALHIGKDLMLHGFACLLDGNAVSGEDRSRGARFNSALRFAARHKNLLVVVVSADRPVSVIQEGVEISAQCPFKLSADCQTRLERLGDWIAGAGS